MAIDDNTVYGLTGAQVKELPGKIEAVKGMARVLTTDDYDWPTSNPTGIAMWLLDDGMYLLPSGVNGYSGYYVGTPSDAVKGLYIISKDDNDLHTRMVNFNPSYPKFVNYTTGRGNTPAVSIDQIIPNINNNLTTTASGYVLDARQGKTLNDRIGDLTTLTTTAQTSAVAAINEINAQINKPDVVTASFTNGSTSSTARVLLGQASVTGINTSWQYMLVFQAGLLRARGSSGAVGFADLTINETGTALVSEGRIRYSEFQDSTNFMKPVTLPQASFTLNFNGNGSESGCEWEDVNVHFVPIKPISS